MPGTASPRTESEVVVVGAGPTGLWLASELALAGVRTSVLEKRTGRSAHARALGLMPRTLEILALRGMADAFVAAGRPVPAWHFGLLEERIRFDVLDTAFPYLLLVPQTTTESLLEQRARELGVDVVTGAEVTGLAQEAGAARVTYERDGVEHALEAALVIGADGGRSTVRELAGIPFEGEPSATWGFLGDVVLEAPPAPGYRVRTAGGALIVAPLPDGRHRLTGWDPRRQDADEALDLETLRSSVRDIAGTDFGLRDPTWLSRFGDANRLAATYRSGRVLLAGDAAHVHWPTGGLGLNAGVQDAMALGWRAAAFVRGSADDAVLDDYAAERRAYGEQLRISTLTQGALITARTPAQLATRATFDRLLATEDGNEAIAAWVAGLEPAAADGEPATGAERLALPGPDAAELAAAFEPGRPVLLVRDDDLLAPLGQALELAADDVVIRRLPRSRRERLDAPRAVLVRPDGRIAWTAPADGPVGESLDRALRAVGFPLPELPAPVAAR
ncbi:FAD-dependent monooxygenase [Amnibacterium setariae]|nr:FAD-dependent monooxygenase [Amnibacterium setariae]